MWYYLEQNEEGDFEDAEGKRYFLIECHRVSAPDGRENEELGYTYFESRKEALETWCLKEIK